jgi:DNA-binding XRE family transcriptional regulator
LLAVKTFDKRPSVDINSSQGLKMKIKNNLKEIREARMLGKTELAELAKLAGVSPLTIDRIERGMPCRIKSQRQIVLALGLKISQRRRIFHDN